MMDFITSCFALPLNSHRSARCSYQNLQVIVHKSCTDMFLGSKILKGPVERENSLCIGTLERLRM
jgi:hypothetical protein